MKNLFKLLYISILIINPLIARAQTYNISPGFTSGIITVFLGSSPASNGTISNIEFSISLPIGGSITVNSNPYGMNLNTAGTLWVTATGSGSTVVNFNPSTLLISFNYTGPQGVVTISSTFVEIGGGERPSSGGSTNIVLPITLKSFTATKLEGSNAILDWTTSSEVDASHFEIERSFDLENWKSLGTEEARGQNGVETNYSFLDQNIIAERSNKGVVYYRIQMIDLDKSKKTSDIRSINLDPLKETYYQAFPNPASGKLHVQLQIPDTKEDMTELLFIDNAGKVQSNTKISTNGITTFDIRDLPKGLYHLQVKTGAEVYTKKVILMDN